MVRQMIYVILAKLFVVTEYDESCSIETNFKYQRVAMMGDEYRPHARTYLCSEVSCKPPLSFASAVLERLDDILLLTV